MIPCKRPRVTVDPRVDRDAFDVNCRVPGCDFTYPQNKTYVALKSDAESTAARHRQEHRVAVPLIEHGTYIDDGRKVDLCLECEWVTPIGFSTAADRARLTQRHLEDDHGLVSC